MANKKIINIDYDNTLSGLTANNVQDAISEITSRTSFIVDSDVDTGVYTEQTSDDDTIRFITAGVEHMNLSNTGNLGIDTDSNDARFSIKDNNADIELVSVGHNTGTHTIYFKHGNDSDANRSFIRSVATGSSSLGYFQFSTGGGVKMTINSNMVSHAEHVFEGNARIGALVNSGVKSLKFNSAEAKAAIFSVPGGSYGRADLRFCTGDDITAAETTENDYRVMINRTGDVSIGNFNASEKLQVDGTIAPRTSGQKLGTSSLKWDAEMGVVNVDSVDVISKFVAPNSSAEPGSPSEGQIYFDTTTKKLRVFDGSAWVNLH